MRETWFVTKKNLKWNFKKKFIWNLHFIIIVFQSLLFLALFLLNIKLLTLQFYWLLFLVTICRTCARELLGTGNCGAKDCCSITWPAKRAKRFVPSGFTEVSSEERANSRSFEQTPNTTSFTLNRSKKIRPYLKKTNIELNSTQQKVSVLDYILIRKSDNFK